MANAAGSVRWCRHLEVPVLELEAFRGSGSSRNAAAMQWLRDGAELVGLSRDEGVGGAVIAAQACVFDHSEQLHEEATYFVHEFQVRHAHARNEHSRLCCKELVVMTACSVCLALACALRACCDVRTEPQGEER